MTHARPEVVSTRDLRGNSKKQECATQSATTHQPLHARLVRAACQAYTRYTHSLNIHKTTSAVHKKAGSGHKR